MAKKKIEKQDMMVEEQKNQENSLVLIDRYKNLSPEIVNELRSEFRYMTKSGSLKDAVFKALVRMEENQIEININNLLCELALSEGKAFKRHNIATTLSNLMKQNKIYAVDRGYYAIGEDPNPKRVRERKKIKSEEDLGDGSEDHEEHEEHEEIEQQNDDEDIIYG